MAYKKPRVVWNPSNSPGTKNLSIDIIWFLYSGSNIRSIHKRWVSFALTIWRDDSSLVFQNPPIIPDEKVWKGSPKACPPQEMWKGISCNRFDRSQHVATRPVTWRRTSTFLSLEKVTRWKLDSIKITGFSLVACYCWCSILSRGHKT